MTAKSIAILIFVAACAILINPVLALDATSSTTRKEKLQQRIDTRKENVENRITGMKEKVASREAAMKAKLQAFKDKRKAEVAERVNTNLNRINQNQTAQMLKHLEKMSMLLDKVEARVNQSAAKDAIAESRAKITAATEAVKTQAAKDYTLTVTSESAVRKDAESLRTQLKTDLMAVRKQVIEAKQSISNVIRVAKGMKKEATSSGK